MNQVLELKITGRAARFIQLLRDFGHLDEEGANQLLVGLGDVVGEHSPVVDLHSVRRVASMVLFNNEQGPQQDVLAEDWPFLFS